MTTFQFTVVVDGPDLQDDPHMNALFDAGCDDATVGNSDGVQYVDFDREAASLEQAVLSAVEDLEKLDGVEVVRIADAGLVSLADIAAHIGRTRESVRLLARGVRGPGGFPKPATHPRTRYRLWRWSEVEKWFKEFSRDGTAVSRGDSTAAINAALELRRHLRLRTPSDTTALRAMLKTRRPTAQSAHFGNKQRSFAQHAPAVSSTGHSAALTTPSPADPPASSPAPRSGRHTPRR